MAKRPGKGRHVGTGVRGGGGVSGSERRGRGEARKPGMAPSRAEGDATVSGVPGPDPATLRRIRGQIAAIKSYRLRTARKAGFADWELYARTLPEERRKRYEVNDRVRAERMRRPMTPAEEGALRAKIRAELGLEVLSAGVSGRVAVPRRVMRYQARWLAKERLRRAQAAGFPDWESYLRTLPEARRKQLEVNDRVRAERTRRLMTRDEVNALRAQLAAELGVRARRAPDRSAARIPRGGFGIGRKRGGYLPKIDPAIPMEERQGDDPCAPNFDARVPSTGERVLRAALATVLRERRIRELDVTTYELGERAFLDPNAIGAWERGGLKQQRLTDVHRIARALELTGEELLRRWLEALVGRPIAFVSDSAGTARGDGGRPLLISDRSADLSSDLEAALVRRWREVFAFARFRPTRGKSRDDVLALFGALASAVRRAADAELAKRPDERRLDGLFELADLIGELRKRADR